MPQHARFNEGAQLWLGLERHILERAVDKDRFRAQVITGPVFGANDPVLDGFAQTPIPLRFWKVVAAINRTGLLFATAYLLDQSDVIRQHGLRAAPDVPFVPYKTYQTNIAELTRLTGLGFSGNRGSKTLSLINFDPLAKARTVGGPRGRAMQAGAPPYRELRKLDDVVVGFDG